MKEVPQNSVRAWVLAARPKTLSAALIPVFTASALAASHDRFVLIPALLCLLFAAIMQIAANFINDLFDYLRGTDGTDRLGPERACAQGWISPHAMRVGIAVVIPVACLCGLALLLYGGWWLIGIGVACVVFAFLYTTLLSYCGLGDLLVWVFFGLVPVVGTYYVQALDLCPEVWWLAAAGGLVTDTLLVLNNYRDRDTDRRAGKRTLIAVFGERFGSMLYILSGLAGCACAVALAAYGHTAMLYILLPYLVLHVTTWHTMVSIHSGRALNRVLGLTSRNMIAFALLVVIGLLV